VFNKDNPLWLVPASLALLIPIIAVLSDAPTVLSVLFGFSLLALATVGGAWFLMRERHKLRMREIEAEARLQRAASEQLSVAERILDKDTGVETLRREDPPQLTN
jgi:hypothetical protein